MTYRNSNNFKLTLMFLSKILIELMFDKFVPKLVNNNEFLTNRIVANYSNIAWSGFYKYLSHWCHLCFIQLYKLERKGKKE